MYKDGAVLELLNQVLAILEQRAQNQRDEEDQLELQDIRMYVRFGRDLAERTGW
jgi:hypothetical protein